jgi:hypothetical protein
MVFILWVTFAILVLIVYGYFTRRITWTELCNEAKKFEGFISATDLGEYTTDAIRMEFKNSEGITIKFKRTMAILLIWDNKKKVSYFYKSRNYNQMLTIMKGLYVKK